MLTTEPPLGFMAEPENDVRRQVTVRSPNAIHYHYHGPINQIGQAVNANLGVNYGSINYDAYQNSPPVSPTGEHSRGHPSRLILTSDIASLLDPILHASHTRNRKTSPPNSDCFPGTRAGVIREIKSWATSSLSDDPRHILWVFGFAGCGKSAVAQSLAAQLAEEGRLGGSFFFFRGAGDRSRILRFPTTIASQIAIAVPGAAQHIEKALRSHPGLLELTTSLTFQFKCLVYEPIRVATATSYPSSSFVVVIDGFDECEDKEESCDFIKNLISLFERHPDIPLRVLITSRVEDHLHRRLHDSNQVRLLNLAERTSDDDIGAALDAAIADAKSSRVLACIGEWPSPGERRALIKHIGGSFIFMMTIVSFLFDPLNNDGLTPIERLPLALNMNPGFDGLYKAILERSQHFPYFSDIISTIALARIPLSISEIAEVLGIKPTNVVSVLVSLHAIFQVPGDDHSPVTLWHTSLRDFLCSEERSGPLFASPWHHRQLAYWYISLSASSAEPLGRPVLEACHHWRMFVEPITSFPDLLKSQSVRIIARLEAAFPADFRNTADIYFHPHSFLAHLEVVERQQITTSVASPPYRLIMREHPWYLFEDIFECISMALGAGELISHFTESRPHLFDPPDYLDMLIRGIQLLIRKRPGDGAPILRLNCTGRVDRGRIVSCWPSCLTWAFKANPHHHLFDPTKPYPIHIANEWVDTTQAYNASWNPADALDVVIMEFVELMTEKVVVPSGLIDVNSWDWTSRPKQFLLKKPPQLSGSVTVFEVLSGIKSLALCMESTCRHAKAPPDGRCEHLPPRSSTHFTSNSS